MPPNRELIRSLIEQKVDNTTQTNDSTKQTQQAVKDAQTSPVYLSR